jgi:hypothetical protein
VFAHSWKHGETLVGNNVSATMFPSLPWALGFALYSLCEFVSLLVCYSVCLVSSESNLLINFPPQRVTGHKILLFHILINQFVGGLTFKKTQQITMYCTKHRVYRFRINQD